MNPFADIDKRIWKTIINKPNEPRSYIGASIIGHPCDRRIWFDLQGINNIKNYVDEEKLGQKYEIYERGHNEEEIFIKKLQNAGYNIKDRQLSFSAYDGKLKGHCDGIIIDDQGHEYLFEFKTMQETTFNRVKKHGIEKVYPHYITQIQIYMNFLNFKSDTHEKKALIICQNKNRDYERHQELHTINPYIVSGLLSKAERLMSYEDQMPGTLCSPENPNYQCKMCDFFKFCYPQDDKQITM